MPLTPQKREELKKSFGNIYAYAYPNKTWTESGTDEMADYWLSIIDQLLIEKQERIEKYREEEIKYPEGTDYLQNKAIDDIINILKE